MSTGLIGTMPEIRKKYELKWLLKESKKFRTKKAFAIHSFKYYYLRFTVKDTKKLISIIRDFIPVKKMLYKIGEGDGRN